VVVVFHSFLIDESTDGPLLHSLCTCKEVQVFLWKWLSLRDFQIYDAVKRNWEIEDSEGVGEMRRGRESCTPSPWGSNKRTGRWKVEEVHTCIGKSHTPSVPKYKVLESSNSENNSERKWLLYPSFYTRNQLSTYSPTSFSFVLSLQDLIFWHKIWILQDPIFWDGRSRKRR
jgi:hypothetical protein